MKPFVVGIAGGSGSGKSSLAFGLQHTFPEVSLIFHIDDYFRPAAEVPIRAGMKNWDDPRAIYYSKMAQDLAQLKAGQPVIIHTKSPDLNPEFIRSGQRIPVEFVPKPLIIVEGFLALHFPKIRALLDLSIYLDGPFDIHVARRLHTKIHPNEFPPEYVQKVLRPMHERYVAPSKVQADLVINVTSQSEKDVLKKVAPMVASKII